MTVTIELASEIEQIAKAKAEARGISLEDYLPLLIAYAVQQDDWAQTKSEESLGRLTMLAAEPILRRIWDTPKEDAAWKYLENTKEDASEATIQGSEDVMRRLWDTPEEDAAWKHLQSD